MKDKLQPNIFIKLRGLKLQQKVNLRGLKRVVFLGGQNHNFMKLRGPKV